MNTRALGEFIEQIEGMVALVREAAIAESSGQTPKAESLPTLLDQCRQICFQAGEKDFEPIRLIHHFACTGGTLISRCIASMSNVQLLSEVDPLSTIQDSLGRPHFAPTDIIRLLKYGNRPFDRNLLVDIFLAEISALQAYCEESGLRLVLRGHAHSHFCTAVVPSERPTLDEIVGARFEHRSIVSVRHPFHSFASLRRHKWVHFEPPTFDEYCKRYILFLDAHSYCPIVRYEDFVDSPTTHMQAICKALDLPYSADFQEVFSVQRLSGDSGEGATDIRRRERPPVSRDLEMEAENSVAYRELCVRLGY